MWQAALAIWTIHNKHLHPSNIAETDGTQLQAIVQQIFHNVAQDPQLQDTLTYTTAEHIMMKPTRQLRQWVTNCHHHINNHKKQQN